MNSDFVKTLSICTSGVIAITVSYILGRMTGGWKARDEFARELFNEPGEVVINKEGAEIKKLTLYTVKKESTKYKNTLVYQVINHKTLGQIFSRYITPYVYLSFHKKKKSK